MFAIIEHGGKQHLVKKGQILKVEKTNAEVGSIIEVDGVKGIILEDSVMQYNSGSVTAEILEQKRDKKIIIFKKKRRKNYRRKNGHRQYVTVLKIQDIKIS